MNFLNSSATEMWSCSWF